MPDDTVTVRYDDDLDIWVIDGDPPGPAGVAAWQAAGVYWAADWIAPDRLVRCEIEGAAVRPGAPTADRTLAVVEALFGPALRDRVAAGPPDPSGSAGGGDDVEIGGATTRRAAGWLAVTLDELDAGAGNGSLLAADALLLARQVGIDDLPGLLGPEHVAEIVDGLDPAFLDALAAEDRAAFDLLRAYGAVLTSMGEVVDDRLAPARATLELDPAELASRFDAIVGRSSFVHMDSAPLVVWCQGLPPGAVVGATARLVDGRRSVAVEVRVGDRPLDALHLQVLRTIDGAPAVVRSERLVPDPRRPVLVGRAEWLVAQGEHVRLAANADDGPPGPLRPDHEAQHWAREAVHLARHGAQTTAGELWLRSAAYWQEAGVDDMAVRARSHQEIPTEPSPFLRDRPAVRQVLGDLLAGDGDPGLLADTAQALGLADLAADARLASASLHRAEGRSLGARLAAGRARLAYARLADAPAADRAAALDRTSDGGADA